MIGFPIGFRGPHIALKRAAPIALPQPVLYDFTTGLLPTGIAVSRSTSATSFAANGTLVTAPAHTARFDHNPITGALRGLLLEGTATNGAFYSAATAANWSATGGGSAVNLTLNALGRFNGTEFTSGQNWHSYRTNAQIGAGNQVFTFYYRLGNSGEVRFSVTGVPGSLNLRLRPALSPVPDLLGANSLCSSYTYTDEVLADGVTRRFRIFAKGISTAGTGSFGLGPAGSAGQKVIILGAQVEAGLAASSYIATAGTSATRAADQLVLTALSGPHDVTLTYEGGSVTTLTSVALTPGSILAAPTGRLRSLLATPLG